MKFLALAALFVALRVGYELNSRIILKRLPPEVETAPQVVDRKLSQQSHSHHGHRSHRLRSRRMRGHHRGKRMSPEVRDFRSRLRRKMQQTQSPPDPTPTPTNQIYTNNDLETIMTSTLTTDITSQANIVVINQPVPIGLSGFRSGFINEMCAWRNGTYPPTNGYLSGAMTIYEVGPMIALLKRIENMYTDYYELLPEYSNQFRFIPGYPPSTAVMAFYTKMQGFNANFNKTRDDLQLNMLFSVSRLLTFRSGQNRMLKFYDMYTNWLMLQQRAGPFEEHEPKFGIYYQKMNDYGVEYSRLATRMLTQAQEYQRVFEYFATEVRNVVNVVSPDPIQDAVEKFNFYLKFVVKLHELRKDVFRSIDAILETLGRLKSHMTRLAGLNADLLALVVKKEQEQIKMLKESEAYLAALRASKGVSLGPSLAVAFGVLTFQLMW